MKPGDLGFLAVCPVTGKSVDRANMVLSAIGSEVALYLCMYTTWIIVAHRTGAKFYENNGPGRELKLLEEIEHPEGRLRKQQIDAGRPGRETSAISHHGFAVHANSHEYISETFAKKISTLLDQARAADRFQKLVLVAEPRFLGWLKSSVDRVTSNCIAATIPKDLSQVHDRDLPEHLAGLDAIWNDVERYGT